MAVYLERRGSKTTGKWYGETTHKGKRYRRRFNSHDEAQGYVDYIQATGQEPAQFADVSGESFAAIADLTKAEHTKWKKDGNLGQRFDYVRNKLGAIPVTSITNRVIQDRIVNDLKKRPGRLPGSKLNAKTINRYLAIVSVIMNKAALENHIQAAPPIPWQATVDKEMLFFTREQEDAVVLWMKNEGRLREALSVRVLAATGLRWSEFALVSQHPEMLTIDTTEYGEEAWVRLKPEHTKTEAGRDVPIVVGLAREWLGMIRSHGVPNYRQLYDVLKEAVKACGYSLKLAVHSFRHATATRVLEQTQDIRLAQEMLGHKSLATTQRYTHIRPQRLQEVAKKLSRAGGETEKSAEIIQMASPAKRA